MDSCSAIARCSDRCRNGLTAPSSGVKSRSRLRSGSSRSRWCSGCITMISIAVRSSPSSGSCKRYFRQALLKKRRTSARDGLNIWFRLGFELAQVADQTGWTIGPLCLAHIASVQNQPVVRILNKLRGHKFQQPVFHFGDILARGDSSAVCNPEDMGIDSNGWLAECRIQDHVRGLAPDTRQAFQVLAVRWNLTAEFFHQQGAGRDDVLRLRPVEANALDIRRNAWFSERQH